MQQSTKMIYEKDNSRERALAKIRKNSKTNSPYQDNTNWIAKKSMKTQI